MVNVWRQDFPIFENGANLAFLDSAASAQKPACVLAAMEAVYTGYYANIHRGLYEFSQKSTTGYETARAKVAHFMNAEAEEIIFTKNATEGINLVVQTWAKANLKAGDGILLTELEHHANIVPWQMLAQELGLEIQVARIDDDGSLSADAVASAMQENTKLVAFTALSNALGTVVDVPAIVAEVQARGAVALVDASQQVVHGGVDVRAWRADFVVWTGHKLYGPTGVGVVYGRASLLADMPPYQGGGDMIETVSFNATTYAKAPARFEAGTPNIAGVIGLGAAVDYVTSLDAKAVEIHEKSLLEATIEGLRGLGGVRVITPKNQRAVVSFTLDGISPHDVGVILDKCGVAVRAGHHCAMPLMARLGVAGTVRASFGVYNTLDDVEKLLAGVRKVQKLCL